MNKKILSFCAVFAASALLIPSFDLSAALGKKQLQAKDLIAQSKETLFSYLDSVALTAGTTFGELQEVILNKKMDDDEWLDVLFKYRDGYFLKTGGLNGDTLLHKAVILKKPRAIIQKLLNKGADKAATNKSNKTAADLIAGDMNQYMLFILIKPDATRLEDIALGDLDTFAAALDKIPDTAIPQSNTEAATQFLGNIRNKFAEKPIHFNRLMEHPLGKKIAQLQDEKGATLIYYTMYHGDVPNIAPLVRAGADRSLRVTQESLNAKNQTPLEFFRTSKKVITATSPRQGEKEYLYDYLEKILDPTTNIAAIKEPFSISILIQTPANAVAEYFKRVDPKTVPNTANIENFWNEIIDKKANDESWLNALIQYDQGFFFKMENDANEDFVDYITKKKSPSSTNFLLDSDLNDALQKARAHRKTRSTTGEQKDFSANLKELADTLITLREKLYEDTFGLFD